MAHNPSYQQNFNTAREEDQTRGAGGDGRDVFGSGAWNALGSIYNYQQPAQPSWDQSQSQNQNQNQSQPQETTNSPKVSIMHYRTYHHFFSHASLLIPF